VAFIATVLDTLVMSLSIAMYLSEELVNLYY